MEAPAVKDEAFIDDGEETARAFHDSHLPAKNTSGRHRRRGSQTRRRRNLDAFVAANGRLPDPGVDSDPEGTARLFKAASLVRHVASMKQPRAVFQGSRILPENPWGGDIPMEEGALSAPGKPRPACEGP